MNSNDLVPFKISLFLATLNTHVPRKGTFTITSTMIKTNSREGCFLITSTTNRACCLKKFIDSVDYLYSWVAFKKDKWTFSQGKIRDCSQSLQAISYKHLRGTVKEREPSDMSENSNRLNKEWKRNLKILGSADNHHSKQKNPFAS